MPHVPDDSVLIDMRFWHDKIKETVQANRVAVSDRELYMASFAGPSGDVKAIKAMTHDPAISKGLLVNFGENVALGSKDYLLPSEGLAWHVQPLGYRVVHAVVVSRSPRFLCPFDDQAMWKLLSSPKFSVPILKEWVPWVRRKLEAGGYCKSLATVHCTAAYVTASDRNIGDVVQLGVKTGNLTIPN